MENRKTLHDYSMILIFLTVLDIFTFLTSLISGYIDGTIEKMFVDVSADVLSYVKVGVAVIMALVVAVAASQIIIGYKGLKASKNPNANKGYITAAKVFFVIGILGVVSAVSALFDAQGGDLLNNILNLLSTIADVIIYYFFIKSAKAVRSSFLENA